jgi:hypothetical protein
LQLIVFAASFGVAPSVTFANTGGVFGPVVNEGHRSAEYRLAYGADSDSFAQRVHYQQAINDDLMWRVVAQSRKTPEQDVDYDFLQGELFWQLEDLGQGWAHGLRFDLRIPGDGRPALLGVNWTHQLDFSEGWQARMLIMSTWQVGEDAARGALIQTRASVGHSLSSRYTLDMLLFSAYGTTNNLAGVDEQFHQVGPSLAIALGGGWQAVAGYLAGLTGETPDNTYRLWFSRRF